MPIWADRPTRGYTARANGMDFDDDGVVGEAGVDDLACDDTSGTGIQSEDVDGDAVSEEQIYVDCDAGTNNGTCGGPDDPCATIAYAFSTRADGPGDGAEDIVCFKGTCAPDDLNPNVEGVAGTYTKTASNSEAYDFDFPADPAMLIGWDADNDNSYPPLDTDDTAVLDGTCTIGHAFNPTATSDYFEYAHFTAQNYGCSPYAVNSSGFRDGGCDYCWWHDLELKNINKGREQCSGCVLWGLGMNSTVGRYMALVNVNITERGGYLGRGGVAARSGYDHNGPVRWQNISDTGHPSDAAASPSYAGWLAITNHWGPLDNFEILDSEFDANLSAWSQSGGHGVHITGIGPAQCTQGTVIRNNLITDYATPFQTRCTAPSFCDTRVTSATFDSNVAIRTTAFAGSDVNSGPGWDFWNSGTPDAATEDCGTLTFKNNTIRLVDATHAVQGSTLGNDGADAGAQINIWNNSFSVGTVATYGIEIKSSWSFPIQNFSIKNNVFAGWTDPPDTIRTDYAPTGWDADYNVYPDGGQSYIWNGGAASNLATWRTNSGGDTNSSECDATFVDQANGDLHLDSSDACAINAGVDLSASGVTLDLDGQTRADPPEIGADELAAGLTLSGVVLSGVEVQ